MTVPDETGAPTPAPRPITSEQLDEIARRNDESISAAMAAENARLRSQLAEAREDIAAERDGWANTRKLLHEAITERDEARRELSLRQKAYADAWAALGKPPTSYIDLAHQVAEARREAERLRGEVQLANEAGKYGTAIAKHIQEQLDDLRAELDQIVADWKGDWASTTNVIDRLRALASTGGSGTTAGETCCVGMAHTKDQHDLVFRDDINRVQPGGTTTTGDQHG